MVSQSNYVGNCRIDMSTILTTLIRCFLLVIEFGAFLD